MDIDWQEILSKLEEIAWAWGPKVAGALGTLVGGWIAAKIVRAILRRAMTRAKVDSTLVGFIANLAYMGLITFVFIAAIGVMGVDTNSFVAVMAAAGLAIGFALQGSLSNCAAGVMIILFRPFKTGDFIEGGGIVGVVEEILVFSTIMKTPDNKRIIVPNANMTGANIINYSANPTRRVDLMFGIGYDDDIKKAKEIFERIVADHPLVLKDPEPQIVVGELADSSVNFHVRPWCKTDDYWTVYFDIMERVKLALDEEGISIPFPQRDIHVHNAA